MKLSTHERESAIWKKIESHLEDRLQTFRQKNDGELSEVETARLRGRISMVKELLALGQPDPALVTDEPQ